MKLFGGLASALMLIGCGLWSTGAAAQEILTLGLGFRAPAGVAVDGSGNVFVADTGNSAVKEILASNGLIVTLASGFGLARAMAVDGNGNIFAADTVSNTVYELPAAGGYSTAKILGSGFNQPFGVAVDAGGNVFVADNGDNSVKEILAAGGYVTVKTLGGPAGPSGLVFDGPSGIALDSRGNVFVADTFDVVEIPAAGGYDTVVSIDGLHGAVGIAVDSSDNVFVADPLGSTVVEYLAADNYAKSLTFGGHGVLSPPSAIGFDAADNMFVLAGTEVVELPAASLYAKVVTLGSALDAVGAFVVDGSGNIRFSLPGLAEFREALAATGYGTAETIATSSLADPTGVAVDGDGNLFVADAGNSAVKELPAAGGYATVKTLGGGFNHPAGVATDIAGNVFVADTGNNAVKEILAAGGYVTIKKLGGLFNAPQSLAVDSDDNIFVVVNPEPGFGQVQEALAAGGYVTVNWLPTSAFDHPQGVALDANGNLFVSNDDYQDVYGYEVQELLVADGYASTSTLDNADFLGNEFNAPHGLAVDKNGDVFVADTGNAVVKEIFSGPPALLAAVLPSGRSVEYGTTATVFATLINTGAAPLDNCQVALPPNASAWLPDVSLSFQTTDRVTNAPTGAPNTPVMIPGHGGAQSFVLSLQSAPNGPIDNSIGDMPLDFFCNEGRIENAAALVPGVDTLDFTIWGTPIPDIIAVAATATHNGEPLS